MPEHSPLRDYSRSRAVLIGAWDYKHLAEVPAACHSLKRMEGLLTGPLCGWPDRRVEVVPNVGQRGDLPDRLMRLFEGITDVALFYFVGHGQLHDDELCLALTESPKAGPLRKTTGLPFSDVRAALRECEAKTKIVILDCCFSGHATRSGHGLDAAAAEVTDMALGAGEFTMAASTTYRTAWFETGSDADRPQTYFTRYLIDTIEQGLPGHPDGLPLGAVFNATADALARRKRPVPTRSVRHHADRFIVAHSPWPGPPRPPQPPEPGTTRKLRRIQALLAAGLAGAAGAALAAVTLAPVQHHPPLSPPRPAITTSASSRTPSPRPSASPSRTGSPVPDPPTTPAPTPPSAPAPSRSPVPAVSVYPVNGISPYDDPRAITASEVFASYDGCYAWLDNDGSGALSGMLNTSYFMSCDADVHRSGGPAVSMAASYGAERTSAVPDTGHTMWICVWLPGYQAGQQCSPPFGIADGTPTQK